MGFAVFSSPCDCLGSFPSHKPQMNIIKMWHIAHNLNDHFNTEPTVCSAWCFALSAVNSDRPVLFLFCFDLLFFFFALLCFVLQRTCCRLASPASTWVPSWRWWSAQGRPLCCAPPAVSPTRRSPGSRTSCPWTPVVAKVASNSSDQVR